MRCHICDVELKTDEIKVHPQIKEFEPCGTCLQIISEVFEDGPDEEEITKQLEAEWQFSYEDDKKVLDKPVD